MALTLPGFRHDMCSTILPLTLASPFFATIDLAARGVELIHSDAPVAHPLDGGRSVVLERSVAATAADLGADGRAWRRLFGPLVRDAGKLGGELLRPVVHVPRHPLAMLRFGLPALRSTRGLARDRFEGDAARALFAGISAHSMLPLDHPLGASFGLVLGLFAHAVGWPMARGGASAVAAALVAELEAAGGEVVTGHRVGALADLPRARSTILDVTPRQLLAIGGDRLSPRTRRRCERFRYGPGVFKLDWALDGPVPWAADGPRRAATIHLGGTLDEIAASEAGRRRRPPPRQALRAVRAVRTMGYVPCAGRQDHRLGVLPRAGGLGRGHDRPHRGPGRTFRARFPRPDPGPCGTWTGGPRGAWRQQRRRRHQRRSRGHPPACLPAVASDRLLSHRQRPVPVLRRRHRRVAGCTGWGACTPHARRSGTSWPDGP